MVAYYQPGYSGQDSMKEIVMIRSTHGPPSDSAHGHLVNETNFGHIHGGDGGSANVNPGDSGSDGIGHVNGGGT